MTEIIITRNGVIVPNGCFSYLVPVLNAMHVGRVCGWTTQGVMYMTRDGALVKIHRVKDAAGRREKFAARVLHELTEAGIPACVVVR